MKDFKTLAHKYWHAIFALYLPIYLYLFVVLEERALIHGHDVHIWLDDIVPYNKYFIIPYLMWFLYIVVTVGFFFFYSQKEFVRYATFLVVGMSICIVTYAVWPSSQQLRPVITEDDIFTRLVKMIYTIDSPTNVCPSIHVLNSIIAHIAICKSDYFKSKTVIKTLSFILSVSICLSTVFLKQHSAFDGVCSIILCGILYLFIYSRYNLFDYFTRRRTTQTAALEN